MIGGSSSPRRGASSGRRASRNTARRYSNGEKYTGDWAFGQRHGRGTYTYADGGSYSGEWERDKIQGEGTARYSERPASELGGARRRRVAANAPVDGKREPQATITSTAGRG